MVEAVSKEEEVVVATDEAVTQEKGVAVGTR